jgi:hypothetical protein
MNRCRAVLVVALFLSLVQLASAQTSAENASSTQAQVAGSAVQPAISGSGTKDYIPLWTSSSKLGNSKLYQTGGDVGVGTTAPAWALDVNGFVNSNDGYKILGEDVVTTPGGTADGNIALGYQALISNSSGTANVASGNYSLQSNTVGFGNTASGYDALQFNTTGSTNTGNGAYTLQSNTTGCCNTASGHYSLLGNTVGNDNTASGITSLGANTTGSSNTAFGAYALVFNTTGSNNIGVGYEAGQNVAAGNSNNIEIGSLGASADNDTIRIGTSGTQTSFFAAGIYGVSAGNNEAIPVLVDSSGQLVTVSSSRRYKEDIHDMADASSGLMKLRPVTFRYKKPLADGSQPMQYGLIAEEVAEVYPDLVSHSADGQIETVKYQLLTPMLLNEVQRQQDVIRELQERLSKVEATLGVVQSSR